MFENLCLLAPDPILGLMAEFRQDPRTRKIDLGVGVYQDESGCTPIMRAVHEAEAQLLRTETTKTYQGIAGDPVFNERLLALLLGIAALVFSRAVQGPEGLEGTTAFLQKRKPNWVPA